MSEDARNRPAGTEAAPVLIQREALAAKAEAEAEAEATRLRASIYGGGSHHTNTSVRMRQIRLQQPGQETCGRDYCLEYEIKTSAGATRTYVR